jgi:hypothetical protein
VCAALAQPLRLHPQNPHYFERAGKAVVLIGSTEHYGAVLNTAFDYRKYLDTLAKDGLTLTRTFMGVYHEVPGSFNIARNTLAPEPGNFIAPFLTVDGKYDLTKWNGAYFERLKDFVSEAGRRSVVVEVVLFCTYYEDVLWESSPLKARNNRNGVGSMPRTEVLTMKHPDMVAIHDGYVRKVVAELNPYDNIYFEICNEPYFSPDWQRHIAEVIAETEAKLPKQHLIAQNIANNTAAIEAPDPRVSLFNFHYARPPAAAVTNYKLNRAIGYDETGFDGPYDSTYRVQAWDFILAGGATYDHLDYSFTVGHEDGTFEYPTRQPGGGSPQLRTQLGALVRFISSFNVARMAPDEVVVRSGVPEGATARALSEPGQAYAIYLHHGKPVPGYRPAYIVGTNERRAELSLAMPEGKYVARWWNPRTGQPERDERLDYVSGPLVLVSPPYSEDIALEIRRTP